MQQAAPKLHKLKATSTKGLRHWNEPEMKIIPEANFKQLWAFHSISPAVTLVYQDQEQWLLGSHPQPHCQWSTTHLVPHLRYQLKDRRTGLCIPAVAGGGCHRPVSTAPPLPALVACWHENRETRWVNTPVSADWPSLVAQCALCPDASWKYSQLSGRRAFLVVRTSGFTPQKHGRAKPMWVLLSRFFLNEGRPNQPHSFAEVLPWCLPFMWEACFVLPCGFQPCGREKRENC